MKNCSNCNKEFIPNSGSQKYCGEECASLVDKIRSVHRNALYHQRHPGRKHRQDIERYAINKLAINTKAKTLWKTSAKSSYLVRKYGISLISWWSILDSQGRCCPICNIRLNPRARYAHRHSIHVDHNHSTGKRRGLICARCNHMLGHSYDNPDTLRRAADYLDKHNQDTQP